MKGWQAQQQGLNKAIPHMWEKEARLILWSSGWLEQYFSSIAELKIVFRPLHGQFELC